MSKIELKNTLNILMIEDDIDHAELTKRILNNKVGNINYIHYKNGEEALNYLYNIIENKENLPDIVLLDLRLPGIDGIDVLKQIRKTPSISDIAIVILSTSGFDHDKTMAEKYNANHYLLKPINYRDFITTLKRLGFTSG